MQFLHFSDTLIITLEEEVYPIVSSDIRYEKLVKLLSSPDCTEEQVRKVLSLEFSSKVKHAGIKDGQFIINNQIVPHPFSDFLLKFKDEENLFEFYYNLYFSITKRNEENELLIWRDLLLNQGAGCLKPFSFKEEKVQAIYNYNLNSKYFVGVSSFITEEDLQEFVKKHFKKNLYKSLKNFVFSFPRVSWSSFKSTLSFLVEFKDNEDKFFNELEGIKGMSGGYQYLDNPTHRQELTRLLHSLQIKNLTRLKNFFGGFDELFPKLNHLHIIAREIFMFGDVYAQEIFFQDYNNLTYETFTNILDAKIKEWKQKYGEPGSRIYFNLEERHPWLLNLKTYSTSEYGDCQFILPNRGLDLDVWSNTMSHCIRTYKESQAKSNSMILLSIINNQRWMIGTLELVVDYTRNDLKVQQFVGHSNTQMKTSDPAFYEESLTILKEAFYSYCRKNAKT